MLFLELDVVCDAGVLRGGWCVVAEEIVLAGGARDRLPIGYSFVERHIELGHLVLELNVLLTKRLNLVKVGVMLAC